MTLQTSSWVKSDMAFLAASDVFIVVVVTAPVTRSITPEAVMVPNLDPCKQEVLHRRTRWRRHRLLDARDDAERGHGLLCKVDDQTHLAGRLSGVSRAYLHRSIARQVDDRRRLGGRMPPDHQQGASHAAAEATLRDR